MQVLYMVWLHSSPTDFMFTKNKKSSTGFVQMVDSNTSFTTPDPYPKPCIPMYHGDFAYGFSME